MSTQSVDKVQYSFLFFEIVIKLICKVAYYLNNFKRYNLTFFIAKWYNYIVEIIRKNVIIMITINKNIQSEILMTTMEEIVPEDSLFRKIDKYYRFHFYL